MGQSGLTLIEALLAVIIVSVAIITIAGGLLVSAKVDNQTNERQRANLALATLVENLRYLPPGANPCSIGPGPQPVTGEDADSNPISHATALLEDALASGGPDSKVQAWVDRGMVFKITEVEYSTQDTGAGEEQFVSDCTAPTLGEFDPWYPSVRIHATACRGVGVASSTCLEDSVAVSTETVKRGGRRG